MMRVHHRDLIAVTVMLGVLVFAGCHSKSDTSTPAAASNDQAASAQPSDGSNPSAGSAPQSAQPAPPAETQITIPAGDRIRVRLVDTIGSARNRSGDTFAATLDQPIVVDGEVVVPRGANVTGRVVSARPSGHLKTPASLAVTLTSIDVDGQSYEVRTSDRSWAGRSHKKHDAKWIAGAGGAGALIGALVGGGKGAAIGAGVGAGGGTATAYATGKKDIVLPSETPLNFRLREPVTIVKSS
jgi:hypothetical protein